MAKKIERWKENDDLEEEVVDRNTVENRERERCAKKDTTLSLERVGVPLCWRTLAFENLASSFLMAKSLIVRVAISEVTNSEDAYC